MAIRLVNFTKRLPVFLALLALTVLASAQPNAAGPRRQPPTRATSSVVKIGGIDYVPVMDLERRFGLRGTWIRKEERISLKNDRWEIELGAESRESQVNGFRMLLGEKCRLFHRSLYVSRIDAEKILGPILAPGYGQPMIPKLRVIAIDPGHGGVDNGAQNKALGLSEKNLALDVALRLGAILNRAGYKVVFTRATDIKIELPLRAAAANTSGADLFVSLHFNSLPNDTKTNGTEIFTFAPAMIRSTDAWGGKTNDTEMEMSPVNQFDHWNSVLAYALQSEMVTSLKTFDRGKKLAHWAVLRPLNCPGVLVESGFLSNEAEARKIATPEYREMIAQAIARGIKAYATTLQFLNPR